MPDPPSLIAPHDVVKIADGVYGFMWRDPLADPIQGNALFVINDNDVVVVDTALLPSTARVMAAELRKLTPKPVSYVINTHWHDDHHGGNAVYRELWPDVRIVGHRETRSDIIEKTYRVRPKTLSDTLAAADRYKRWAASGKDDEGKVLDERRRTRAGEIAVLDRAIVPELRTIQEAPPDVTFTDQLVLYRGGRTIEVRWLGLANTRGDTVVVLPRERIAASGDLVVHPIPFMFGSYHEEWVKTLDALDGLPVDTFLPGHGPLLRDRTYLRQVRGLLQALVDRVKAAVAAGATLEQTQQQVTLQDWRATLPATIAEAARVRRLRAAAGGRADVASGARGAGQVVDRDADELRRLAAEDRAVSAVGDHPERDARVSRVDLDRELDRIQRIPIAVDDECARGDRREQRRRERHVVWMVLERRASDRQHRRICSSPCTCRRVHRPIRPRVERLGVSCAMAAGPVRESTASH